MPSDARRAQWALALVVGVGLSLGVAAPVGAHTGLESSNPADGEIVSEPVSQISLTFNRPVEPAGSGLTAFDGRGVEHRPDAVNSTDGQSWLLHFETPLASGDYEVRWRVAAEDGHIVGGSLSFTVDAPRAESSTAVPATEATDRAVEPAIDGIEATAAVTGGSRGNQADPVSPRSAEDTPGAAPAATTSQAADAPLPSEASRDGAAAAVEDLAAPPDAGSGAAGALRIAEVVRIVGLLATLATVGGLAFASFVVRDEPAERARALRWAAVGGFVLAAGAVASALTHAVVWEDAWSAMWSPDAAADALSTSAGVAVGLSLLGGIAVFAALWPGTRRSGGKRLPTISLIGAALVIASYSFDGHTVTEGPRWLHAAANATHVYAAAVWSGGLALLADLIRRRRGSTVEVIRPLMRFSQLASASFVLAAIAGTVMAVLVMDRFADLWSTTWGRLLLAKIALVAMAVFLGARNRWAHMPAVMHPPAQNRPAFTDGRLHRTVAIEAVVLGCVGVITAFLVGASAL